MSEQMIRDRQDWIPTYSGGVFFLMDPQPALVHIADIAHALAHLCRFTGHTIQFYSVAQHSVLVSRFCAPEDALWGLLHDASEAYVADLNKPLKRQPSLVGYRDVEASVQRAICQRFELPPDEPQSVKDADGVLLRTEQRDLVVMPDDWTPRVRPLTARLVPLQPYQAEREFITRFHELMAERAGGHQA